MNIIAAVSSWWIGHISDTVLQTQVADPVNEAITAIGQGFLGEASSSAAPALDPAGTYVADAAVTFTLTEQRRIRIAGNGTPVTAASAPAHYGLRVGYTAGAAPGAQTPVGPTAAVTNAATGGNSANSGPTEGTVLLPAGQYTAFIAAARISGGSTTDTLASSYVAVYDVGAS